MNGVMYGMYADALSNHLLSDNGSPTPPPLEELKSHMSCGSSHHLNGLLLNFKLPDSPDGKMGNENLIDELNLSRNFSRMCISDEQGNFPLDPNRVQLVDHSIGGANGISLLKYGAFDNYRRGLSECGGPQSSVPRSPGCFDGEMSQALLGLQCEFRPNNLIELEYPSGRADSLFSQMNCSNIPGSSPCHRMNEQANNYYHRALPASNLAGFISQPSIVDAVFYAERNGMISSVNRGELNLLHMPQTTHQWPHLRAESVLHCNPPMVNGRTRVPPNIKIPQGGLEAFTSKDSLIMQGEGLNYVMNKEFLCPRGRNCKGSLHEIGVEKPQEKTYELDGLPKFVGICENGQSARPYCSFILPPKCNSLVEAQGYVYLLGKDQRGCRFLQRVFDEGTPQDVQIIFSEIICHVVELVTNPFGNYLMQKLLEVCNEEQRMQILLMITEEPGQLVRISLNTHGTRVVQKLIETLKTRQQISLLISALEPGFLALIKDLNGNHVVQRCLQCLSNEDNKFIFVAAAKYCVDIATHQHGCCVLQRCIRHSTGEHQDHLVAEISANGLLLAQDAFGNYVVQVILELKIPSATSNLSSQFEGNYVHLSTQKFSSHVVEKCLLLFTDKLRSKIIHELLSASHFEQLLQDPHANYVVQTALRVSQGSLHNLLIEAVERHKAISRNSPYSKSIFSRKLLKK